MEGKFNQTRFESIADNLLKIFRSQKDKTFKFLKKDEKFQKKVANNAKRYSKEQIKSLLCDTVESLFCRFLDKNDQEEALNDRYAVYLLGFSYLAREKMEKESAKAESVKTSEIKSKI